ncbi:MAG TPA: MFS transporter, partial [Kofleriaceae bacterium]|nr:MFS transporter [Kofleriaceae bacterium]
PPAQRIHAYGLLHWVINIGFAFATIIGGLLAEVDFTILFLADAATMAAYGVIVLALVPETRPAAAAPVPETKAEARASRSWLADGPFLILVALTLLLALLPNQAGSTLSAHMTWQGFTPAAFGAVMAVNGVLIIALQPSFAAWSTKRDPSRVLAAASLLYGLGIALHGLAPSVGLHAAAVSVWTIGEIFEAPSRAAVVAAMAPADARGRYQGAVVMAFGAAQLIAPKLGTWTWEHAGPDALWSGCLAAGIAVALAHLAAGPARRRRMAAGTLVSGPSPSGSS